MAGSGEWHAGELLAFDLETTGVDRFDDVPVSFALVRARDGAIVATESGLVDPGRDIPAAASAVHGITTARARSEGSPLPAAVALVAERILDAGSRGVPIVGMNLDYDLTMLDSCRRRVDGRGLMEEGFGGPVLDVLVLDRHYDRYRRGKRTLVDLCREYGVVVERAHDAAADAAASLAVLTAMCGRYEELSGTSPNELHRAQIEWHRDWAVSYSEWCRRNGRPPLDAEDTDWPIAARDSAMR